MEHRRRRPHQARARRQADPPPARALRARRPPALRPGQVVSRRDPAALDLLALLARRRQADLAGRRAGRARKARRPRPRPRMRSACSSAIAHNLGLERRQHRCRLRGSRRVAAEGSKAPRQRRSRQLRAAGRRSARAHGEGLRPRADDADELRAAGPALERDRGADPLGHREMEDAARQAVPRSPATSPPATACRSRR